ncbi:MAG: transcription-repair coupling factor [Clostridia bacterium]|nr:transcription-repair coupling factor [Clostridia bacterium]
MNTILGELGKSQKFVEQVKHIETKKDPIVISGLTGVGMVQQISAINEYTKKTACIITYNEIQAKKIVEDLKYFTDKVVYFNKKEIVTYDFVVESKDLSYERIETLNKIYTKKNLIVVTTIEAIMQEIAAKNTLYKNVLSFKIGEEHNFETLKQTLVSLGYSHSDMIEGKGQFSIRGGILDISLSENVGVRIEFWGDEVDSIRKFSITTQRSTETIEKVTIYPATEFVLEKNLEDICENILKKYPEAEEDTELIKNGSYISKIDKYFDCFYENKETVLDYLSSQYTIFVDEINKIKTRAHNITKDTKNIINLLVEKEKFVPEALLNMKTFEEIEKILLKKQLVYIEKQDENLKVQAENYSYKYREINYFKSESEILIKDLTDGTYKDKNVYILTDSKEKAKKICSLLNENEILNKYEEKLNNTIIVKNTKGIVTVSLGNLSSGFENYDLNQVVIDANELVEIDKKRRRTSKVFNDSEKVVYSDLKIGDYVVHKIYGIGIFIGINTITADNTTKDYIKIKYKNDDILYVPTSDLDVVRKYIGGGESAPKVNRLGSKEWENTKAKVKNNLREVAKELIELYATREKAKGYAFSQDTPWQSQFENSFEYVETDDQLRCIEEVKKDMELSKPMDRLLCGDVGYGKTEVAIRAAFKAVMDQKQVAYLVPTTVLADQQYKSFKERMEEFPIRVDVLNRFRTTKEQHEIIKKLKLGEIDVVIGTHRLLSKDVEFKDLGLLIIDEEHRFGVKDKEKIKQYKANVDVLTMSATPIPRTLHMSIVGVRDMSVIYEPPQNRKPVQTYVLEYDDEVIKEAITKELERGGQVFYLFNNVSQIERKAATIARLVPEATVDFAHGRMSGSQIEDIMHEFIEGNTNVLVCTTILESGIDIPNANTIIVENADRMGLAQLYQIRGRVGRSNRQAYAYITYKRDKLLSEVADKRLKAIKEFTEFGSGFKIAMRDLEIRGAGSLLGEIQHGHMEQVGYDTYCKLLDEVMKETQGIKQIETQELEVQIDLNVSSYIPDEYISNQSQKIEVYQDIALCKNEEDVQNIIDEIIDRYGNMPTEVENLIKIARIKNLCKENHIEKVYNKLDKIVFTFARGDNKIDIEKLLKQYRNKLKFSSGIRPGITLKTEATTDEKLLNEIQSFLLELS